VGKRLCNRAEDILRATGRRQPLMNYDPAHAQPQPGSLMFTGTSLIMGVVRTSRGPYAPGGAEKVTSTVCVVAGSLSKLINTAWRPRSLVPACGTNSWPSRVAETKELPTGP